MSTGPRMVDITRGPTVVEERRHTVQSTFGNDTVIECPFCKIKVKANTWSFQRVGKRCECGALHLTSRTSYHWAGWDTGKPENQDLTPESFNLTAAAEILVGSLKYDTPGSHSAMLALWSTLTGLTAAEALTYATQIADTDPPILAFQQLCNDMHYDPIVIAARIAAEKRLNDA